RRDEERQVSGGLQPLFRGGLFDGYRAGFGRRLRLFYDNLQLLKKYENKTRSIVNQRDLPFCADWHVRKQSRYSVWSFSEYHSCAGCDCTRPFSTGERVVRAEARAECRDPMVYLQCGTIRDGSNLRRVA